MLKNSGNRQRSRPNETIELTVHGLSHDGRGIVRQLNKAKPARRSVSGLRKRAEDSAGKVIFVPGTVPGEKVSAKVTRSGRRFDEAELISVLEPAADRVEPVCGYYGRCGGCVWQHVSHERQLLEKQQQVLELLARQENIIPEKVVPPLIGPAYGIRSRAGLTVNWHKGNLQLGFRELGSHKVCDIKTCPLLVDSLQKLLPLLRELLNQHGRGVQRVDLDTGDDSQAILLEASKKLTRNDRQAFIEFGELNHIGVFLRNEDGSSECLYAENMEQPWLSYGLPDYDLQLKYLPSDFTQVNRGINRLMVKQAIEWLQLEEGNTLLDLYCGLGNFALPAAVKSNVKVTGVEGSHTSVARAQMNASAHQLEADFYVEDLRQPSSAEWAQQKYDKILLDPPRAGAGGIISLLEQWQPERIVYVSCNPGTFVRDATLINARGYKLEQLGIMDMFPQTAHVETMASFCRQ